MARDKWHQRALSSGEDRRGLKDGFENHLDMWRAFVILHLGIMV